MLANSVICSTVGLIVACLALFIFGHRIRRGHWLASLAAIAVLTFTAWTAQHALTGNAPPFDGSLISALVVGAAVTAAFERWNAVGHAAFTASLLAAGLYLGYAGFILVAAHLGPWSMVLGAILFVLQLAAMALLLATTFEIIDVVCRTDWQNIAQMKRVAGYTPKVSLHVPIHREPPEMVIDTLNAISRLEYKNYEVLVIDNNTEHEELWRPVERHCARLGARFRFFHLLPWPGYKAGALNFALGQTAPDAEIIGVVDADYRVETDWLSDLTGHFSDPQVAFVQTPQDYRDSRDRGVYGRALALAYMYFFRISMASRNERNAIIFAGTMGLVRKSALQEIGGWNEWCITEDAEVSLRLLDAGYRGLYVGETYGRGIMPLDYAGLKKQRYRWAFGGMQILRLHAGKLFNPLRKGKLTVAQRWAYVSGGLQWLHDPLALAFTVLLLIGAGALLTDGTLAVQPFLGAVLFTPPVFLLFAITRFLWALRVRERCSLAEATRALAVLIGLTWIVTLACARGLVSRHGVFLRTPKQGGVASAGRALEIVRWEVFLGCSCLAAALALIARGPFEVMSARALLILLLFWQACIYLSALLSSAWDYRERRGRLAPARLGFRTLGHTIGTLSERRTAVWVAFAALILGTFMYLAQLKAPPMERLFRADPLGQFLSAPSLLSPTRGERAGAMLVAESEAARRGDIDAALALWSPEGVIVDENFSPTIPADNRVWQGREGLRARYAMEFQQRRYLSLRHLNLDIQLAGEYAVIVNDVEAVVKRSGARIAEQVHLLQSDRWLLQQVDGQWQILRLEVNRMPRASPAANRGDGEPWSSN